MVKVCAHTMAPLALLRSFSHILLVLPVLAGNITQGGSCSPADDYLDPSSHRFLSDCDETTFCSPTNGTANNVSASNNSTTGTCEPRQCRRDEFPFGYADSGTPLPPLCTRGTYCPDEGSGCEPLRAAGQACQLNRDDQCAPPPDWAALASTQNFNGSLCLQQTCMYANASLGQACILDTVTYVDVGPDGQQYLNGITRDNCQTSSPQLYCDGNATQCVPATVLGAPCDADRECLSFNCGAQGTCADPSEMPLHVAPWQYVLTILSVLTAMTAMLAALVLLHKRLRLKRYCAIREYYEEQMSLRRSIAALHAAAAERYEDEKYHDEID